MCCKIILLVDSVLCISPDTVIVNENLVENMTRILTLCYEVLENCKNGVRLASAISSILWTLVRSNHRPFVFTSIENHWDSFTGLLPNF